jgi:hypothetical protein
MKIISLILFFLALTLQNERLRQFKNHKIYKNFKSNSFKKLKSQLASEKKVKVM